MINGKYGRLQYSKDNKQEDDDNTSITGQQLIVYWIINFQLKPTKPTICAYCIDGQILSRLSNHWNVTPMNGPSMDG